jgi:hypothetical protein
MDQITQPPPTAPAPGFAKRIHHAAAKHLALGFLVFFCGLLVGHASSLYFIHAKDLRTLSQAQIPATQVTNRLDTMLGLSKEQQKQVQAILERELPVMTSIRDDAHARIYKQYQAMLTEISAVLDERQRQKLQQHVIVMEKYLPPITQHITQQHSGSHHIVGP